MYERKLKYQHLLEKYPDCPPQGYKEIELPSYRWVYENLDNENNFKPLNLISNPPQRMLDNSDSMCLGFGLSFFNTFENAYSKYRNLHKSKKNLSKTVGRHIAVLNLQLNDGRASEHNKQGHFTFHEYENADLRNRVIELFSIFDSDGKFKI